MGTTRHSVNSGQRRIIVLSIMAATLAITGEGDGVFTAPCALCGTVCDRRLTADSPDRLELGHIISASDGGRYRIGNLIPECRACQQAHGDLSIPKVAGLRYYIPADIPRVKATEGPSIIETGQARKAQWHAPDNGALSVIDALTRCA